MVALAEELLVVVSDSVGITPVAVVLGGELCLRSGGVTDLGVVAGSQFLIHLVGVVVAPAIAELGTEGPTLEGLPIDACVVILTETALYLVGSVETGRWIDALRGRVLFVFVTAAQHVDGSKADGLADDGVGGVAFLLGTGAEAVDDLISQTCIEVK